jgi:hypothetical protein
VERPGTDEGNRTFVLGFGKGALSTSVDDDMRPVDQIEPIALIQAVRHSGRAVVKVRFWHVSDDEEGGKVSRLCPGNSDVDLFGYGESVINLNAEIPDCALDLVIIPPACD